VLQGFVGERSPCTLLKGEGGWYAVLRVPSTRTGEEWSEQFLEQAGVFVHPGFFFDFERDDVVVMSLLPPRPLFRDGVRRIMEVIQAAS
jgi:aspartate/methionine/tyrosine aminotransferase